MTNRLLLPVEGGDVVITQLMSECLNYSEQSLFGETVLNEIKGGGHRRGVV